MVASDIQLRLSTSFLAFNFSYSQVMATLKNRAAFSSHRRSWIVKRLSCVCTTKVHSIKKRAISKMALETPASYEVAGP